MVGNNIKMMTKMANSFLASLEATKVCQLYLPTLAKKSDLPQAFFSKVGSAITAAVARLT